MIPPEPKPPISDLQTAAARARKAYRWEDAVAHYSAALSLPNISPDEEYDLLDQRAYCYQRLADYQAEFDDLAVMAQLAQGAGDDQRILEAHTRQAITLVDLGEIEKSRRLAEEAHRAAQSPGLILYEAKALYALGLSLIDSGEYAHGAEELNKAIQTFRSLGALREEAMCAYHIAFAGSYTGRDVERYAQRVMKIAQQLDDRLLVGRANHILGIINDGNPTLKMNYHQQALEIYQAVGEVRGISAMTHNLGVFYLEFGVYKRAYGLFRQAVQLAERINSRTQKLLSLHLSSWAGVQAVGLDDADEVNQRVIIGAREAGVQDIEAYALTLQGWLLWKRGELETAIEVMQEAADKTEVAPAFLPPVLGWLGLLHYEQGDYEAALQVTEKALEWADEISTPAYLEVPYWSRYRVLQQSATTESEAEAAWETLLQARDALLERIENLADQGLRRSYLSRPPDNPDIILEWARLAAQRGESLAPLMDYKKTAENLQLQFKRLLDTGTRLASQSDPESTLAFIMDEFVELSGAERVFIALGEEADAAPFEVILTYGLGDEQQSDIYQRAAALIDQAILSRQAVLSEITGAIPAGDPPEIHNRSAIVVPLVSHSNVMGVLYADVRQIFGPFNRQDADLLTLLTNQAAAALENANWIRTLEGRVRDRTIELETANKTGERLLKEMEERNAEISVINSIQAGLASKLDIRSIYELVGERISEIFSGYAVGLYALDTATNMGEAMFMLERGVRHYPPPFQPGPIGQRAIETKKPLMISTRAEFEAIGAITIEGTAASQSGIYTPLVVNDNVIGALNIESPDEEYAFSDSDLRLVTTIANSMSVALENAHLFDETQSLLIETEERNAELAVINAIQQVLAAELGIQAIYEAVGEKLREIFDSQTVGIYSANMKDRHMTTEYVFEKGEKLERMAVPFNSLYEYVLELNSTIIKNGNFPQFAANFEDYEVPQGEIPQSILVVPVTRKKDSDIIVTLTLQDMDGDKVFTDSDVRLLETIASSMSVALENARLFDEVHQSNREIAAALERQTATSEILRVMASSQTEVQPVLEAVAENAARLCEADDVQIYQVDGDLLRQVAHFGPLPALQDGEALPNVPGLITGRAVIEHRSLHIHDVAKISKDEYPDSVKLQKRLGHRSVIVTPLIREELATGAIVVRRNEVRPFSEKQITLLSTFADQAAIAIENVRLFNETTRLLEETEQHAAELAIINRISQALVAETELEALIQLIGEQIRQTFIADIVYVALLDRETDTIHFPYTYGDEFDPLPLGEGLTSKIIESGEPLLINREMDKRRADLGTTLIGKRALSFLGVPIQIGNRTFGVISLQSTQEEGLYDEDDLRVLNTIAANISTAIRNASLFDEIKHQKQYYQAVIEHSPAAIVLLDLDANVTGWNPAAEKLFGYDEAEVMGQYIDNLIAKTEALYEEAAGYSKRALSEKRVHIITKRSRKDGSLVDVEVSAVPVIVDGKQVEFIAIYHDITELQRARQAAEEANQAKSAFLANMSHELRTPLNAIIGFTRIVRRKGKDDLPQKQIENLDKVLVSADHLLGLINTVLDISKIEAGRMEVQPVTFELPPLIDLVVATSQPLLPPSVKLEAKVASALPTLYTDQDKLKQILLNLLSNAAKFTQQGQITLQAWAENGKLTLKVQDTGIGVSPEALEKIFEEFQQADTSTTREYGGTGLGLSISKKLAQLLGGDLTASSVVGEGSIFTLTTPLHYSENTLPKRPRSEAQEESHKLTGQPLILSIDDDPHIHELLKENLGERGYQVLGTCSSDKGLRLARELAPFAITLDIMMPGKNGWQVLHELKADPFTRDIPVILVTILDKQAFGYHLGAADYLVKPLEEDAVLSALQRIHTQDQGDSMIQLLVIDDDPNIPDIVRQLLADAPYQIDTAPDGQTGLEAILHQPPDLILLDLMMPHMDGFALIESLREKEISIPIIILTAKALNTIDLEILEESVERVIQKNRLDQEEILAELHSTMEDVRMRMEGMGE